MGPLKPIPQHTQPKPLYQLFATPWTITRQAVLSMEFSRQEYWSELPLPTPGDLPNPGIKPRSPALQADSLLSEPQHVFILLFPNCLGESIIY